VTQPISATHRKKPVDYPLFNSLLPNPWHAASTSGAFVLGGSGKWRSHSRQSRKRHPDAPSVGILSQPRLAGQPHQRQCYLHCQRQRMITIRNANRNCSRLADTAFEGGPAPAGELNDQIKLTPHKQRTMMKPEFRTEADSMGDKAVPAVH